MLDSPRRHHGAPPRRIRETSKLHEKMQTIEINTKPLGIELLAIARDIETNGAWRNGIVILQDGSRIDCGGGWIENEDSANQKNEEAGIAGGLRQGVSYPNETAAGEFSPYSFGEDESGWQEKLMPVIYGADWEERENADEESRKVYATIQAAFQNLAQFTADELEA